MNPSLSTARADTRISETICHEWIPVSFDAFLEELEHLRQSCSGDDPLPLFRGHAKACWILDSTFARECKKRLFDLPPEVPVNPAIQESREYHLVLLNLLMLKFGVLSRPSEELLRAEARYGIDAWFEFLRRCQQYPDQDLCSLKGTFIMDWSRSADVGLFFANWQRAATGAVWVLDACATGSSLQTIRVGEILDRMFKVGNRPEALGSPLIFYPERQILQRRVTNQRAVYLAQMELRYDMAAAWKAQERAGAERIYVKLLLPAGTQHDCAQYLESRGVTEQHVFPAEQLAEGG